MTKKLIVVLMLSIALFWGYHKKSSLPGHSTYVHEKELILAPLEPEEPQEHEAMPLVREINKRNALIQSVFYKDMAFRINQGGGLSIKLNGFMAYEKNRKFRMTSKSFFGKETDVGSNSTIFWFWSKRMKPSALYWAKHERLYETRLRTPFNPMWIMESFSINEIDTSNATIARHKGYWAVFQPRISASGQSITKVTLLDEETKTIVGHYVYDMKNNIIISTEITEFYSIDGHHVPKRINIIWHEEDIKIQWDFEKPKVNKPIDTKHWEMPSIKSKINLNTENLQSFLQISGEDQL